MSKRFKITGEWSTAAVYDTGVVVEECDLEDTLTKQVWAGGASRVKAPGRKTFVYKGESAWANAQRTANDYNFALMREGWAK